MRLLGPSVLRIGGGSVDFSWWTSGGESPPSWATSIVTPAAFSSLRGLLTATGWRVLLGVDLGHFEPARVADEARYAREILGGDLLASRLATSQTVTEKVRKVHLRPSTYSVGEYIREAEAYSQALSRSPWQVSPYGPASTMGLPVADPDGCQRTYIHRDHPALLSDKHMSRFHLRATSSAGIALTCGARKGEQYPRRARHAGAIAVVRRE